MSDTNTTTAEHSLRILIGRIGGGFHPDTRGADYDSLPDGVDAETVDRTVDEALAAGVDVYGVALDVVNMLDALAAAEAHNDRPLIDHVRDIFPNAEPLWQGRPNPDTAEIVWGDNLIRVTCEGETGRPTYLVGLYPFDASADEGEETYYASCYVEMPMHAPDLLRYLDDITEEPDGVDWGAWAQQWTSDAIDDGRLDAELLAGD